MSDRPVVLGAGVEAFPEEGLGECKGDEAASGFQTATYLREEPRKGKEARFVNDIRAARQTGSIPHLKKFKKRCKLGI